MSQRMFEFFFFFLRSYIIVHVCIDMYNIYVHITIYIVIFASNILMNPLINEPRALK